MALDNFAALTAQMQQWAIDRPDLVPIFQDCIDMAINDINQVLRMKEQMTTVTLQPDSTSTAPLPDDYLEWRSLRSLASNPRVRLVPLTPEGDVDVYPYIYGASPAVYFMMDDSQVFFQPSITDPIEMKYWAKVPYLTPTPPTDTNWLLQMNANLILFGAMKYVEVYKRNDKGMQTYGSLYSNQIDGMVRSGKRSQWSRTRARVSGRSTP